MVHNTEKKLSDLMNKVEQHEETIAQLVIIIAETNRRISELTPQNSQSDQRKVVTF